MESLVADSAGQGQLRQRFASANIAGSGRMIIVPRPEGKKGDSATEGREEAVTDFSSAQQSTSSPRRDLEVLLQTLYLGGNFDAGTQASKEKQIMSSSN